MHIGQFTVKFIDIALLLNSNITKFKLSIQVLPRGALSHPTE